MVESLLPSSSKYNKGSQEKALIIDSGTFAIKAGFAGDGYPKLVFPSIIVKDTVTHSYLVGKDVFNTTSVTNEKIYPFPYEKDWNFADVHRIITYIYQELHVDPKITPVLFGEPTFNSAHNHDKLIELFFKEFQVPKLLIAKQSELILHAMFQRTGLVIDLGYATGYCVPYYEGFEITPAIRKFKITGKVILEKIQELISKSGTEVINDYDLSKKIDTLFYVANNFDIESQFFARGLSPADLIKPFSLAPDKTINIGEERFKIPELLFQPNLFNYTEQSLTTTVLQVLEACPLDVRKGICKNIILSGGLAKIPGLELRLKSELSKKLPADILIRINTHPKREWTSWIGGDSLITKGLAEQFWHNTKESAMKRRVLTA
jgi:actin-related protein